MEQVNEVWENQRFYGIIGWCVASALRLSQHSAGFARSILAAALLVCSYLPLPSHAGIVNLPSQLPGTEPPSHAPSHRQSPGLLERPSASDAEGFPIALDKRPTEEEPLGWRLVVSPATDIEGWQYASVFK
jgi:hypothetical protein